MDALNASVRARGRRPADLADGDEPAGAPGLGGGQEGPGQALGLQDDGQEGAGQAVPGGQEGRLALPPAQGLLSARTPLPGRGGLVSLARTGAAAATEDTTGTWGR